MQRYRILCLDDGGIRGLIAAIWLQQLEQKLNVPLREHFDLAAGTSTGSLLACVVSLGLPTEPHYEGKGLEKALVMKLGKARTPLIDGGVVANNPAACAIAEGVRANKGQRRASGGDRRLRGASFGTGELTRSIDIAEAREWGALE